MPRWTGRDWFVRFGLSFLIVLAVIIVIVAII